MSDELSLYDYELPAELIASQPLSKRDASRLLFLDRKTGKIDHHSFREFPELLRPGDLLVLNETRVIAARLCGVRTRTGGKWEGLFLGVTDDGHWRLIGQTRGKLQSGESITILPERCHSESASPPPVAGTLNVELLSRTDDGEWTASPSVETPALELLERYGRVPLPPYIERPAPDAVDRERYQTTYARTPGAIAAPTAGLHFTPEILQRCREQGIGSAFVTLHVGLGTFRPITAGRLSDHLMHHEWCELPQETVDAIAEARAAGGRIIAVGTTTVRTLESVAARGPLRRWSGETNLFIRPPFGFRAVDALLTNFHLPRSTLLVLVSAFAGREAVLSAYGAAIAERYRFYSYGDAMLIR